VDRVFSLGLSRGPPTDFDRFPSIWEGVVPFIAVPETAQVTMVYTGPNQNRMVNVYHFSRPTLGWDADSLGDLGEAMLSWEVTYAKDRRSNQITCIGVECRDLSVQDSFVVTVAAIPPIEGGASTPVLPANVTLAVSLRTPFAGRSFRGRTYWIGLPEGAVVGDFVNASTAQNILTAVRALIEDVPQPLNAQLVVVSRYSNGVPRATGIATPVTAATLVDTRVDTQRRRLVGVGE
jgi:hypothetical protein